MFAINTKTPDCVHRISRDQRDDFGQEYLIIEDENTLDDLPTVDIVTLYNAFSDHPVSRFSTRDSGIRRLYKLLGDVAKDYRGEEVETSYDERTGVIEVKAKHHATAPRRDRESAVQEFNIPVQKRKLETKSKRVDKGVHREPYKKLSQARSGTKTAIIIDLLARDQGATPTEIAQWISGFWEKLDRQRRKDKRLVALGR
jgi:hypothetical protein